jgi:hypothetical protein
VCDAVAPVAVWPSPNAHAQLTTEPSASAEPVPSNEHPSPVHDGANAAVGLAFAADTVTLWVTVPVAPSSSVTVSVTSYEPAAA